MGQKPEENKHEVRQRSQKIGKIVPQMRRRNLTSAILEGWTNAQWATISRIAGVNTPSEKTRRQIIGIMSTELHLDRLAS